MKRKSLAARLEALETAERADALAADRWCDACRWRWPDLGPLLAALGLEPSGERCVVCGVRRYAGQTLLATPDRVCPRCGHAHAPAALERGPCPRCGWFAPHAPYAPFDRPGSAEEDAYIWGIVASLHAAYGPGLVAAWLDLAEGPIAEELPAVAAWWFDELPASALEELRDDVVTGAIYASPHRTAAGEAVAPCFLVSWEGPRFAAIGEAPDAYRARSAQAQLLTELMRGLAASGGGLAVDRPTTLAALDTLRARLDMVPAQRKDGR